jgi:integrase
MSKLTALKVARTVKPGLYSDGLGLYLQVRNERAKSWVFRFQRDGKTRYLGLGSAFAITLARARELAAEPRRIHAEGGDPLEQKRQQETNAKLATAKAVTFESFSEDYISSRQDALSARHAQQWRVSLATHIYPALGDLPIGAIDDQLVIATLERIWKTAPQTASRVRGRIEAILSAAKVRRLRAGDNPARWRGHLDQVFISPRKLRAVRRMPALPYAEMPEFMATLRGRQGVAALALQFTILTAVRTSEAIGARWEEIDLDCGVWTIPASRMKAKKEHRVPLSTSAMALLKSIPRNGEFVFTIGGQAPINSSSMRKLLELMGRKDITPHGFRSTFRDWAGETTAFPHEVMEMALAHTISNQVEKAYRRGDLFEKRARLMDEWAKFCERPQVTGEVVGIRG